MHIYVPYFRFWTSVAANWITSSTTALQNFLLCWVSICPTISW